MPEKLEYTILSASGIRQRCLKVKCRRKRIIKDGELVVCMRVHTARCQRDPRDYTPPPVLFFKHVACAEGNMLTEAIGASGGKVGDVPGMGDLNDEQRAHVHEQSEPKPKAAAPKPKPKAAAPKPKPKPKAATPKPKAATPKPKAKPKTG
jgi:hypothetical protein